MLWCGGGLRGVRIVFTDYYYSMEKIVRENTNDFGDTHSIKLYYIMCIAVINRITFRAIESNLLFLQSTGGIIAVVPMKNTVLSCVWLNCFQLWNNAENRLFIIIAFFDVLMWSILIYCYQFKFKFSVVQLQAPMAIFFTDVHIHKFIIFLLPIMFGTILKMKLDK